MDRISRTVEASKDFRARMKSLYDECLADIQGSNENLGSVISRYGVRIAAAVDAKAIVTPTIRGNTARILSVFRPSVPILAVTPDKQADRVMQLYWGVNTRLRPMVDDAETMIEDTLKVVSDKGVADTGDKILLVAGLPLESPNPVNTVRVIILGTADWRLK